MRGAMIAIGARLVAEFSWILSVFGALLILTAMKMAFAGVEPGDPGRNVVLRLMRRFLPVTKRFHGEHFFVRAQANDSLERQAPGTDASGGAAAGGIGGGRWMLTPLAPALVMVEITDLVFAVDSIPAIFAITADPFLVFSSNVFAILGLRSLYFALAGALHVFRYLKYALALVHLTVGVKMLAHSWLERVLGPNFSLYLLATVVVILATGVLVSLIELRWHDQIRSTIRGTSHRRIWRPVRNAAVGRHTFRWRCRRPALSADRSEIPSDFGCARTRTAQLSPTADENMPQILRALPDCSKAMLQSQAPPETETAWRERPLPWSRADRQRGQISWSLTPRSTLWPCSPSCSPLAADVHVSESPLWRQHHSERSYVATDDEWPDGTSNLFTLAFIPEGRASNVAKTLVDEKTKGAVLCSLDSNGYLSELGDAIRQRDGSARGGSTVLKNHLPTSRWEGLAGGSVIGSSSRSSPPSS
jgi:TerC family integral membrane protein